MFVFHIPCITYVLCTALTLFVIIIIIIIIIDFDLFIYLLKKEKDSRLTYTFLHKTKGEEILVPFLFFPGTYGGGLLGATG